MKSLAPAVEDVAQTDFSPLSLAGHSVSGADPRAGRTPGLLIESSDQLGLDWGSDSKRRPEATLIHSHIGGRSEPIYIASENALVLINNNSFHGLEWQSTFRHVYPAQE